MSLIADANAHSYNPTFGTEILVTVPAHMTRAEMIAHIRFYLKTLKSAHRKHVNWLAACDAYSAGLTEAPKLSRMPSKTAKHRLYGASGHMNAMVGWDRVMGRCGSLGDIGRQIEAVEIALAKF